MAASKQLDHAVLAQLLRKQHDVITRAQALSCGMTRKALRHRLRPGGPWRMMLYGVYLARTGTPTTDQRDMAALLYAGPRSVITGCAALRRLGLKTPPITNIDVLVPAASKRRSSGFVRVLRTTRMPEQFCASGRIRFTMAARAVADAARTLTDPREVRAVVAGSLQSGWCRMTELARELSDGPVAGSARLRRVLAEAATGVRSVSEGEFRDLVIRYAPGCRCRCSTRGRMRATC